MRTYVRMVVCIHLPRFALMIAAGGRSSAAQQALAGRALALAPLPGRPARQARRQSSRMTGAEPDSAGLAPVGGGRVGEVSGAAEAHGVVRGMALGEALARCPQLELVAADPVGVAEAWRSVIDSLESIGAAVEPARAGLAYFCADGLRGLYGDDRAVIAAARRALRHAARVGAGPTRFCAMAAALAVRSRRALVLEGKEAQRWLAARPIELLGLRAETEALLEPLQRLGVRTLGELAALSRDALADRFGGAGVAAHDLARGEDRPLRPRDFSERVRETLAVGDASSGQALQRVLGVLVDRLLARRERRGRSLRAVTLSARLLSGGGWRERVVFRQALSDRRRILLALSVRLAALPAPAGALALEVERFGPAAGEQRALLADARELRAARLREAVAQTRAVAGADAALRAVCVDLDSRVPERRVMLTPLQER
jgi:protein ImuB